MSDRVKILFLASNPADIHQLNLDEEAREIEEKMEVGTKRDSFKLITHWAVRPTDLQRILLKHNPHIVHFSGHGTRTKEIVLENGAGQSHPVGKQALAKLFTTLKDNVRIVVFNACFSKAQAAELTRTIDYTIGMSKAVGDKAAIAFAAAFYRALTFGRSVTEAFELATIELELIRIPGSKTPQLFIREGVDPTESIFSTAHPAQGLN